MRKYALLCIAIVTLLFPGAVLIVKGQAAGDGMLLKRSPEETCHGCHKTDQNAPGDANSLKTHNSINTGSTKWAAQGGWGVTGSKYDEFRCTTCHTAHDTKNIYLLKETIATPDGSNWASSGAPAVTTLFKKKSLADNPNPGSSDGVMGDDSDAPRSSSTRICQVCHSQTNKHSYAITSNAGHQNAADCTTCHSHTSAFSHAGGSGAGCGTATTCHGTKRSHPTHVNSAGGKGMALDCSQCHNTANFSYFRSKNDPNAQLTLAQTDICNDCHSPGGTYDGVNDTNLGAKNNWTNGVYTGNELKAGREKWCATCHDESPAVISAVTASNVVGNESAAYTYGMGWGYFKTGHGLPSASTYASSGGRVYGADKECDVCHDFSTAHIDGNARTYAAASNNYQAGYRLKSIDGKKPLNIPRPTGNIPLVADDFRLCFSCHDANKYLLQSPSLVTTSFRDDIGDAPSSGDTPPINAHNHHLDNMGSRFDSDWNGSYDSQISCVVCHNVHGSTRLSMVNDGKLVNKEPGLQIYYAKDGTTTYNPPWPPNEPNNVVTLDQSDGTVWDGSSPGNICSACHGGNYGKYYRTPPAAPQAPVLAWTGESGYTTDGAEPNSSQGGAYFTFRIKYGDANYQIPRTIQVWVDLNDNGSYEDNEKFAMQDADSSDIDCSNGKLYRKTIAIGIAGDGTSNYRFYASDGKFDATGAPTADSSITLANNAPVLSFTGESGYAADGVSPDSALAGSSFVFRIKYTDAENQAPTGMQVWIDENDNGSYEAGEKYETTAVDAGDTTYSDGKLYTLTRTIAFSGDGALDYRFYASDGTANATGTPTTDRTLLVTAANTVPTLAWTGEANYVLDGVHQNTDVPGASFTFRISYADAQNTAPSVMQVWLDENGNGIYEAGEKYAMTAEDTGDNDYTNGKLYTKALALAGAGDGIINYRFYASDGSLDATGAPTADSFLTVLVNAITVSCTGGKDYTAIQAAVNAAASGDTVLVSDCTYTEKVTVDAKSITIKSVNGAAATIIDGGGSGGSVVKFQNGSDSTLNGFTVRNGVGGLYGGGIYISNSSPIITNSIITNNDADNGAGIYLTTAGSATVTIKDSTVSNNITSALEGGGLYLGSGGSAMITGSTFNNNQGRYSGGIYMTTSANALLSISDSAFSNNRGTLAGGAIYVTASGGTVPLTITNTTFSNNDANDNGGALFITTGGATATLTITGSTFTGNNTTAQGSALDGGAIYLASVSSTTISGSTFTSNTGRSGGALYVANSGANSLSITDSIINGNSASALQGGGLYISGGAAGTYTATIERTAIAGNQADDNGGGVFLTGSVAATFTNCMITGNKAVTLDGGGLHVTGATIAPTIINSTIAGNYANDQGGGIYNLGGSAFILKNSIVWNNTDTNIYADIAGPATASYSDIWQPGFSGSNNISSDPLFVNPVDPSTAPTTTGNYHLLMDSPAMDVGSATGAPSNDIDGNVRPIGAGYDMGADEIVTVANNTPVLAWTGESGYTADGVSPDIGAGGASFEFRMDYSDSDNNAPSSIQVWVDTNDNGIYDAGEKYDMTAVDVGDTNYTDGKLYTKTLNLAYAGDGVIKYRFYAADGYVTATGQPTSDKTVVVNTAPVLSWIGSGNFVADGVHPDSGASGTAFEFRTRYTDVNNTPPTSIQVWVDRNDDGDYLGSGEKLTMAAVDSGDTNYTDGKDYTRTVTLTKAGDNNLNYRFYAANGIPATGAPTTTDKIVTVTNNVPTLAWTGEANYATDGVDPNSAIAGNSFIFRVKYSDADNEAPTISQAWVDENNNGAYEDGEKYAMTAVDAGDTVYTDGKLYTKTLTLNTAGSIKYKFLFNDGADAATSTPASDSTVSVTGSNTPPVLDWTGESGYTADGVNPDSYSGGANFTFRVKYTDAENTAPTSLQVWVDKNDNLSYEVGEKYDMTAVDAGDTTYSDGKLYTAIVNIPYAGDGVLNYRFYAHDGADSATGNATADKTVTVVNPKTVPGGYATIAAAITASASGDYILVSDGTYNEKISYGGKNITILSVNGAAVTKIQGDNTNNPVVTFSNGEISSAVLDGFTIDNQAAASTLTRGIYISNNSEPTIKNCVVQGNNVTTGSVDGGGIYINGGGATIQSTTIGGSGNANSGRYGSGIYATTSSKTITISDSSINYNSGTYGTGIYLTGITTTTTIANTSISNNTSTQSAGGIYSNNSAISLTNCTVNSNATGSTSSYDGGGIYLNGASASATISGGTISSNSGRNGGGIYILNSTAAIPLSINNATISSNTGNVGGGIYISGVSNASVISNTSISSNATNNASGHGGGIYSNSPVTLTNCTISSNAPAGATADGGGVYLTTGGTSTITDGAINGNSGRNGAGVYMGAGVTLTITGTNIANNTCVSGGNGGGIYSAGTSLSVTKANIKGNRGGYDGGGIYTNSTNATITNCVITGNTTDQQTTNSDGGGIYVAGGTVNIYNSTIAGNYASGTNTGGGGGLRVNAGTVTVRNSIIHSNTAGNNPQLSGAPTTTYTDIQGGCAACLDKTGNIDAMPQFITLVQAGNGTPTIAGNYHLCYANGVPDAACTTLSPCIDTASSANAPADDIDGNARPTDISGIGDGVDDYDMGADEYVP